MPGDAPNKVPLHAAAQGEIAMRPDASHHCAHCQPSISKGPLRGGDCGDAHCLQEAAAQTADAAFATAGDHVLAILPPWISAAVLTTNRRPSGAALPVPPNRVQTVVLRC